MADQEVWLLCSFYHEPLRTWIKTNDNNFAISNHMVLELDVQALRSYLSLICEYELNILPNKKVSTATDHGKNFMKDRPPLFRHLLRNCPFGHVWSAVEGIQQNLFRLHRKAGTSSLRLVFISYVRNSKRQKSCRISLYLRVMAIKNHTRCPVSSKTT